MSEFRNLTRNILRTYRTASPVHLASGLGWYDAAFTQCEKLGWRYGWTVTQSACALAKLSPRITWRQNLAFLEALLAGGEKPASCLTRSWTTAAHTLAAADPLATFSREALKTGNFARAILGDRNAVVVDVWSARVAGVGESMIRSTAGYHAVAEAYRRGGRRVGIAPRDIQAVTWCQVRGAAA